MNVWLQTQNRCGIEYRRLSMGLQQRRAQVHLTAQGYLQQKVKIWVSLVWRSPWPEIEWERSVQVLKWGNQMQIRAPAQGHLLVRRQRIPLVQDGLTTMRQYPRTTSTTLRKSTETYYESLVFNQTTACFRLTSIWWSEVYLCQRQRRRRYILDTIISKIFVPPRTLTSRRSNIYLIFQGNRSGIKKYMEYLRLIWRQFHGWEVLCWTTKVSSCQRQKCTAFQIRCFVWEAELLSTRDQSSLGKTQLIDSCDLQSIVNWTLFLGNPVVFEWKISQGTAHTEVTSKSLENDGGKQYSARRTSKIESSSCRCTATSIGD